MFRWEQRLPSKPFGQSHAFIKSSKFMNMYTNYVCKVLSCLPIPEAGEVGAVDPLPVPAVVQVRPDLTPANQIFNKFPSPPLYRYGRILLLQTSYSINSRPCRCTGTAGSYSCKPVIQ